MEPQCVQTSGLFVNKFIKSSSRSVNSMIYLYFVFKFFQYIDVSNNCHSDHSAYSSNGRKTNYLSEKEIYKIHHTTSKDSKKSDTKSYAHRISNWLRFEMAFAGQEFRSLLFQIDYYNFFTVNCSENNLFRNNFDRVFFIFLVKIYG